jgi:hypothetical protein
MMFFRAQWNVNATTFQLTSGASANTSAEIIR